MIVERLWRCSRLLLTRGLADARDVAVMSTRSWQGLLALVVLSTADCAQSDAQFNVEYAPGFPRGGASVSIFGIFKDGRMSADSWEDLGRKLTAPLGNGTCEIAYSDELIKTNPGLSSAVDDYARADGLTDELLGTFAPVARGDLIMSITVAGQARQPTASASAETPKPTSSPPSRKGGGSRGRRRAQAPTEGPRTTDRSALEVSATLFAVSLGHSVAVVSMTYSGSSGDEALRKFAEKLAVAIPGSVCAGWNWNIRVDEDELRRMTTP
jgi:hypothetical protein